MSVRKENKNFHTTYDDKTLENMNRYYRIDTDDELMTLSLDARLGDN